MLVSVHKVANTKRERGYNTMIKTIKDEVTITLTDCTDKGV